MLFVKMIADVKSTLAGVDRLTYKERPQLERALWGIELFINDPGIQKTRRVSQGAQMELFEDIEGLEWLKLPPSNSR